MSIRFKTLWKDHWPYHATAGVGLLFQGYPRDEKEFKDYLWLHSCHPDATTRILQRLKQSGEDRLTVMSGLNFDCIAKDIRAMGVTITVIAPQEGWHPRFQNEGIPDVDMDKVHSICQ